MRELTKAVASKDPSDIVTHHKVDFLPHHVSVSHTHTLRLVPFASHCRLMAACLSPTDMLELDVALCSHTQHVGWLSPGSTVSFTLYWHKVQTHLKIFPVVSLQKRYHIEKETRAELLCIHLFILLYRQN